ncbi:uncharacterized protein DS421_13g392900 [Arachis hypogaea]|nr:uncharacterized protein DS421_13g392900 [Arachis hypogaea]
MIHKLDKFEGKGGDKSDTHFSEAKEALTCCNSLLPSSSSLLSSIYNYTCTFSFSADLSLSLQSL